MSTLTFDDTHNMVAFLEKPTESDGFHEIIDFLNANQIYYALTINPTIYTSCIKQFWATTKVKTVNGERQLQALVDKKKVILTETSIRSDLNLEDAGVSKSHQSVRSEAQIGSKSKSVKSKPLLLRASRRKSSSDSGYDTVSGSGSEDLSMPYRRPKLMSFTSSAHIKGVPPVLRISVFMHGHGHPELAKKLNDKIPKTVDEMWERVRAFIRGETVSDTTEVIRSPLWEKSAGKASWSKNQNGSRNREILVMDNVNFPPPPPMMGSPEKRNMNKFCDYHQDRGHNTNDCYHLKKQIEEAVASGRLAHLVKDIRQSG
ncbi:hypothetical protein Tco_0810632 [Tanacetum coccineum]